MSRAEALSVASDHLSAARSGLGQVVRILTTCDLPGPADQAADLGTRMGDLHQLVRTEADVAHRVENPGAYDIDGLWIGRQGTNRAGDRKGQD